MYLPGPHRSNWERKLRSVAAYKRGVKLVLPQLVGRGAIEEDGREREEKARDGIRTS